MRTVKLLILAALTAGYSLAAIAFVSSADLSNNGGSGGLTASFTVPSGSNQVLFVYAAGDTATDSVSAASFNGTALTLLGKIGPTGGGGRWSYLFGKLSPTATTANVVLTCSTGFCGAVAAVYSGVLQSGLPDAVTTNAAVTSSLATTLSSVADNCWFVYAGLNGVGANTGNGFTTMRQSGAIFSSAFFADSNGPLHPAGSYTMTATEGGSATGFTAVMISMAPAVAATFTNAQVIIF